MGGGGEGQGEIYNAERMCSMYVGFSGFESAVFLRDKTQQTSIKLMICMYMLLLY